MSFKWFLSLWMGALRCAPAILLPLLCGRLSAEPLADMQARFGVITGDVGLLSQGAAEWIEPHEGLPLEVGDHIRTGEDGTVEILVSEHALWVLQPKSDAVIEHTEVHSGRLDLFSGRLLGRLDSKRTAGKAQRWEFVTPAVTVHVHGTEFAIRADRQGSDIAVFEGEVDIQPAETAEGPQPAMALDAGHEAAVRRGKPVHVTAEWSPAVRSLAALRADLKRRQKRVEDTWSPLTTGVRTDSRKKFVAPPVKARVIKRRPPQRRSSPSSQAR